MTLRRRDVRASSKRRKCDDRVTRCARKPDAVIGSFRLDRIAPHDPTTHGLAFRIAFGGSVPVGRIGNLPIGLKPRRAMKRETKRRRGWFRTIFPPFKTNDKGVSHRAVLRPALPPDERFRALEEVGALLFAEVLHDAG